MAQVQWQSDFCHPIWDLRQWHTSLEDNSSNDVFQKAQFCKTPLCGISWKTEEDFLWERIKGDNIILYIDTPPLVVRRRKGIQILQKNPEWNCQAIWQHNLELYSMISQYVSKYLYSIQKYPLTDIGEIMNG